MTTWIYSEWPFIICPGLWSSGGAKRTKAGYQVTDTDWRPLSFGKLRAFLSLFLWPKSKRASDGLNRECYWKEWTPVKWLFVWIFHLIEHCQSNHYRQARFWRLTNITKIFVSQKSPDNLSGLKRLNDVDNYQEGSSSLCSRNLRMDFMSSRESSTNWIPMPGGNSGLRGFFLGLTQATLALQVTMPFWSGRVKRKVRFSSRGRGKSVLT